MTDEKTGEKEERLFEPEVEGSLEKFEADLLREDKRKTTINLLAGFVIVMVMSGGSYLVYTKYIKPQFMPMLKTDVVAEREATPKQSEELFPKQAVPADIKTASKAELKTAPKPDVKTMTKAGIKEEILQEAPAKIDKKTSGEKTAKAKKPPLIKAKKTKKTVAPPPRHDSGKTVTRVAPKNVPEVASLKEKKTAPQTGVLDKKLFTLQVGFFRERANALRMKKKLEKLNLTPTLRSTTRRVRMTTVYSGEYPFREFATKAASDLLTHGFRSEVAITGPGRYELDMGRFASEALADNLVKSLEALQLSVRVEAKIERVRATIVLIKGIRGKNNLQQVQELLGKEKLKFILVK